MIEAACYVFKIAHLSGGQTLAHFAENVTSRP